MSIHISDTAATSQEGSSLEFVSATAGEECYIQDARCKGLCWQFPVISGNRPSMPLLTMNETGTSRTKTGTITYKTGQQGQNRDSWEKNRDNQVQNRDRHAKSIKTKVSDLSLLVLPFLYLICPCFSQFCMFL